MARRSPPLVAALAGALFVTLARPPLAPAQVGAVAGDPAGPQDAGVRPAAPVLQPGDVVRLVVWRDAEMSGEFEVRPDSTLGHPLLRQVKVGGVPLPVAEERLRVFLGRFANNPDLVLLPSHRVFVTGEVLTPGVYTFSPDVTIAKAVLLAGGPTDRARMDRVRVLRDGQEQIYDLSDLDSRQATLPIRSGDLIVLERSPSLLRDYLLPGISLVGSVTAILTYLSR